MKQEVVNVSVICIDGVWYVGELYWLEGNVYTLDNVFVLIQTPQGISLQPHPLFEELKKEDEKLVIYNPSIIFPANQKLISIYDNACRELRARRSGIITTSQMPNQPSQQPNLKTIK